MDNSKDLYLICVVVPKPDILPGNVGSHATGPNLEYKYAPKHFEVCNLVHHVGNSTAAVKKFGEHVVLLLAFDFQQLFALPLALTHLERSASDLDFLSIFDPLRCSVSWFIEGFHRAVEVLDGRMEAIAGFGPRQFPRLSRNYYILGYDDIC